jgi:SAM-dependent methyltransferase
MNIKNFARRVLRKLKFLKSSLQKTADCWDNNSTALASEYWWNVQALRRVILEDLTGDSTVSWFTKTIRERPTPFGRILTFGDGHGMAAEAYLTRKDASEIIYLNISPGEGARFMKTMEELNIDVPYHFVKADANTFEYSSLGFFDTIIDVGAFHHFERFERVFPALNKQLSPDGFMYIDEYVGPSMWKFPQTVIDRVNEWLSSLPEELIASRKKVTTDDFFNLWKQSGDPSECRRSGDLDKALRSNFKLIEESSFGGTLLMPFFLSSNLIPCRLNIPNWHNTEIGVSEAERLARLEMELIKSNEINKDYVYYIFRKLES